MLKRTWIVGLLLVAGLLMGGAAFAADGAAEPTGAETGEAYLTLDEWLDACTHPVDWLCWGADLRIRQVYMRNAIFLESDNHADLRHFFRTRVRAWVQVGPFFGYETIEGPDGLSVYVRLTGEPRHYMIGRRYASPADVPQWDEVVYDNLYVKWVRIDGHPVSFSIGRQDILYGRGFVILDGTPLDGSRTIFSDAAKLTLHFDRCKTNLDLFVINNKARQSRLRPIMDDDARISEYDTRAVGAYLISKAFEGEEIHAYYIYKDDDVVTPRAGRTGRIVHTLGALIQGKAKSLSGVDYYAEGAYQWGHQGTANRYGYGVQSEVGYSIPECPAKSRVHIGYQNLSGDDAGSSVKSWDPVLARWPHWSELYVYRWAAEQGGQPGYYTNLQRLSAGFSAKPSDIVAVKFNYHWLYGNHHDQGTANPYAGGHHRGDLITALLTFTFTKRVTGHLTGEYFIPGDFYHRSTDNAILARWQLNIAL